MSVVNEKRAENRSPGRLLVATRRIARLRNDSVLPALVILVGLAVIALIANWLPLPGPKASDLAAGLLPPFRSGAHPLGTDPIGRDIFSRLVFGARISLTVGLSSVLIALVVGTIAGLLAGYYQGWIDILFMRLADIWLSLPSFILALTIMTIFGAGEVNVILALSITGWVRFARVARSTVLPLSDAEYVQASRALGCSSFRTMFRHILPNVVAPLIVVATLGVGANIISESSLSFLGLGVDPQTPSWGIMLANGRDYLQTAPWVATIPGIAISLTVLATNIVGDWLRDVLDPRTQRRGGLPVSAGMEQSLLTDVESQEQFQATENPVALTPGGTDR